MSVDELTAEKRNLRLRWMILCLGAILLLAACGPSTPPEQGAAPTSTADSELPLQAQEADNQQGEGGYPSPIQLPHVDEAYPVGTLPPPPPATQAPASYPAAEEAFVEPRFRIDVPLSAASNVVTGQAPPNLAIAVADISSGGELLGSGVSDAEGQFRIGVSRLPEGDQVGITFAELQPGKTYAEMSEEYFPHRGDGFMNIPNIGIFFDSAIVSP